MQGRVENKLKTETLIKNKISSFPSYVNKYYYSLSSKTHATKNTYITNVIRFLNYLVDKGYCIDINNLKDIDSFVIEEYISDINYFDKDGNINELKGSTKAIIYCSLASFFSYLSNNDIIDKSPFDKNRIERPKINENDVTFLSPDEVKRVSSLILSNKLGTSAQQKAQRDWIYRDYLLFRIPVINGLRVRALSEINVSDINIKDKSIKVIEKGNISKKVYFDEETKKMLLYWLNDRKDILDGEKCDALFISNRKERMSVRSIERVISKYTDKVTYKHITPHKLRSTFGTNLYQSTKDIYLVADALGHKSTAPTKRYTKIFDEDKRNAIDIVSNMYK